jgi:hypothetical protein
MVLQEPELFAFAEPEPECISVLVPIPEPGFDADSTLNGIFKVQKSKTESSTFCF